MRSGIRKKELCIALVPVLKMTRSLEHLEDLQYYKDDFGGEFVDAKFTTGSKTVNVTADSGIAMIKDIIRALE